MKKSPAVDKSSFFHEVTLRVCGTLEIEKALWKLFLYVKGIVPGDEIALVAYNEHQRSIEVVATANEKEGSLASVNVPISVEAIRHIEAAASLPSVRIVSGKSAEDPIAGPVCDALRWPRSSVILINRLIIDGRMIGALYIRNLTGWAYTEEQAHLWSLVNEPAAIALANSRRHREVFLLKELLADDNRYLQDELRAPYAETIIGADFGLRAVMEQVRHVAPLSSPVLLTGETGTGKEVIATAIHNLSRRSQGPFIKVNCGAIPESLVDSELFGHEKGSFTGAFNQRRGRFERASGGTIFLDEVGELPLPAQVRLLRVLQEKTIERVGGSSAISVDIRLVSATNRNLEEMLSRGTFREDLYYRIKVFPIAIPPLRERNADIPALLQHFVQKKAKEMKLLTVPDLSPGVVDRLMEHKWPGNVRELENAVERALILSDGRPLTFDEIFAGKGDGKNQGQAWLELESLRIDDVEGAHIRRVLDLTKGRIEGPAGAALLLGLHPSTLRHRMRKLGIGFGKKAGTLHCS